MPDPQPDPFSSEAVGRLLGEVQQFGLSAASSVIGRFSELAADEARKAGRTATVRTDIGQWVEATQQAWSTMLGTAAGAVGPLADAIPNLAEARPGGSPATDTAMVKAPPVSAGAHTTAEVWVHNVATTDLIVERVTVGEFRSSTGELLDGLDVRVGSVGLPLTVAAGVSAHIPIRLEVPADACPGTWYSSVFIAPHGGSPLGLSLQVTAAP